MRKKKQKKNAFLLYMYLFIFLKLKIIQKGENVIIYYLVIMAFHSDLQSGGALVHCTLFIQFCA